MNKETKLTIKRSKRAQRFLDRYSQICRSISGVSEELMGSDNIEFTKTKGIVMEKKPGRPSKEVQLKEQIETINNMWSEIHDNDSATRKKHHIEIVERLNALKEQIEKMNITVHDCHDGWHQKLEEMREKRSYDLTVLENLLKDLYSLCKTECEEHKEDRELLRHLVFSNKIIIALGSAVCILNALLLYRLLTLI